MDDFQQPHAPCNGKCLDVTLGGCSLNEDDVIKVVELAMDKGLCQDLCSQTTNCAVYQHKSDRCTLLREDYRQDCSNAAGPPVMVVSFP